ncbi:MAG TPA: hypothetical protein VGZ00_08980 [Candidatus Baltobacteraceae bacterium]|jgi:acetate kinase|nr:hypothetical protein [Candidatus Baltobacteraceae bacterium]
MTTGGVRILCCNVGSSSLRTEGFISVGGVLDVALARAERGQGAEDLPSDFRPDVVVHRIVRGLKIDLECELITPEVEREIAQAAPLAPTHDLEALAVVRHAREVFPNARQLAAYDTAFHATMTREHTTYAIPQAWRALGIRRIGYHGFSHGDAAARLRAAGARTAVCCHLGGGCSTAAIVNGRSVASSMGFTPIDGLVMGTRSGALDPGVLIYLLRQGISIDDLEEKLNRESGLFGLCGTNNMRTILKRVEEGDPQAQLTVNVFVDSAAEACARMAVAAGGIEALSFAGGIGSRSPQIRTAICEHLRFLGLRLDSAANEAAIGRDARISSSDSAVAVWTYDVQEERMMALAAMRLLDPACVGAGTQNIS